MTSNKNGSSFFWNAASYRSEGSLYRAGSFGYYWSRLFETSNSNYAYGSYFNSSFITWFYYYRVCGLSVRPVRASGSE